MISPDWPLSLTRSPVPLPYKMSRVSHNVSYSKFGTNTIVKNLIIFKREWNWTLSVSERGQSGLVHDITYKLPNILNRH